MRSTKLLVLFFCLFNFANQSVAQQNEFITGKNRIDTLYKYAKYLRCEKACDSMLNLYKVTDANNNYILNRLGQIYRKIGNYDKSWVFHDSVKNIAHSIGDFKNEYEANLRLGWLFYYYPESFEIAKGYFDEALLIATHNNDYHSICISQCAKIRLFIERFHDNNNSDMSKIEYAWFDSISNSKYLKNHNFSNDENSGFQQLLGLYNLFQYTKNGSKSFLEKAKRNFTNALKLANTYDSLMIFTYLGGIELRIKNKNAIDTLLLAKNMALKIGNDYNDGKIKFYPLIEIYNQLNIAYALLGDTNNAYKSLLITQNLSSEFNKQNLKILDIKRTQDRKISENKFVTRIIIASIVILFVCIITFIYFKHRDLRQQMTALANENKNLHSAKNILENKIQSIEIQMKETNVLINYAENNNSNGNSKDEVASLYMKLGESKKELEIVQQNLKEVQNRLQENENHLAIKDKTINELKFENEKYNKLRSGELQPEKARIETANILGGNTANRDSKRNWFKVYKKQYLNDFCNDLENLQPYLTQKEIRLCCYYFLEISHKIIADIEKGTDRSSITKKNHITKKIKNASNGENLYSRLESNGKIKNLDEYLKAIYEKDDMIFKNNSIL